MSAHPSWMPKSIASLAADLEARGGHLELISSRGPADKPIGAMWAVCIARRYQDGVHDTSYGNVGFYLQANGRPMVSGVARARADMERFSVRPNG